jgi:hypothetical protein
MNSMTITTLHMHTHNKNFAAFATPSCTLREPYKHLHEESKWKQIPSLTVPCTPAPPNVVVVHCYAYLATPNF